MMVVNEDEKMMEPHRAMRDMAGVLPTTEARKESFGGELEQDRAQRLLQESSGVLRSLSSQAASVLHKLPNI